MAADDAPVGPMVAPSAGYTITLRVELTGRTGILGGLTTAIGGAGGDIGAVDLVGKSRDVTVRDISVICRDELHGEEITRAAQQVPGVAVISVTDRTFAMHEGGKIAVTPKFPLHSRDDLSMAYTPGVGRVSQAIADRPERAWDLTMKRNAVAIISDGSAVLGLGNVGPLAALPVMEGKAMLFKEFAGIDGYPICVRTRDVDEIVALGEMLEPGFGGINLEDIAAPGCFYVERRLQAELDIPVFHDDQHGTATVVLAALINAARVVGKPLADLRVVLLGLGAAGVASANMILEAGIGDLVAVDRPGIMHAGMPGLGEERRAVVERSNRGGLRGSLEDALRGADVLVGVSGARLVRPEWVATMAKDAVVFALANPVPEIMPEEVPDNVAIIATGRSDYPNQINNALVFPGFFRGLLDARARRVGMGMKQAAAKALADVVVEDGVSEEYIVPSVFDRRVAPAIAAAVTEAAGPSA